MRWWVRLKSKNTVKKNTAPTTMIDLLVKLAELIKGRRKSARRVIVKLVDHRLLPRVGALNFILHPVAVGRFTRMAVGD